MRKSKKKKQKLRHSKKRGREPGMVRGRGTKIGHKWPEAGTDKIKTGGTKR
jgi:hypothetical protein